jgi:hypothetical protein
MIATRMTRSPLRLRTNTHIAEGTLREMAHPRTRPRDAVFCWGGQGKRVGLRLKFILHEMGIDYVTLCAIDGDAYDLPSLALPGYSPVTFSKEEFLVLGADKTRDDLRADPFLRARYDKGGLWRGVPVSETFQRGGRGGLSYPTYAAAYYESERERALATIHQWLAPLAAPLEPVGTGSDLQVLYQQHKQAETAPNAKPHRLVNVGSGVGSWGWIGHGLGAYDLRLSMNALGILNYELWGIVLGPNLYVGLTPNIQANWRALIDQLRYLSRHGLHRKFGGHGADVDIDAPPYDPGRLFCADQARGPHDGQKATEEELDAFQWNVAVTLALLLTSDAGDQLVSYSANPATNMPANRRRQGDEIFGTLGSAVAGVDMPGIRQYIEQTNRQHLLAQLREQIE